MMTVALQPMNFPKDEIEHNDTSYHFTHGKNYHVHAAKAVATKNASN